MKYVINIIAMIMFILLIQPTYRQIVNTISPKGSKNLTFKVWWILTQKIATA